MSLQIQNPAWLPRDICIFFCWQDHLDNKLHRFLIRDALNVAIGKLQSELPDGSDCILRQGGEQRDAFNLLTY